MNIVKCTNGHFFDSDKYDECPYCAEKGEHVFEERRDMDDQMTISGNSVFRASKYHLLQRARRT